MDDGLKAVFRSCQGFRSAVVMRKKARSRRAQDEDMYIYIYNNNIYIYIFIDTPLLSFVKQPYV